MKIGLIQETKIPVDRRCVLSPQIAQKLCLENTDLEIVVQSSPHRCFHDEEYKKVGIPVVENLEDCDLILGVKEVHPKCLIPHKKYMFFSHVAKKQLHNRKLFQDYSNSKITLIDYEYLVNSRGRRTIAFGFWAGFAGTYNAFRGWGLKTNTFELDEAQKVSSDKEMIHLLRDIALSNIKILVTGGGRAAQGAMSLLRDMHVKEVSYTEYLVGDFSEPVFARINTCHYMQHKDNLRFDYKQFRAHPDLYYSIFYPYATQTDILICCHLWNAKEEPFFTVQQMCQKDFRISLIADISCDINGAIPATIRATTHDSPFYDYNIKYQREEIPFKDTRNITIMSVDNLPSAMCKEASIDFGKMFSKNILRHILEGDLHGVIEHATILEDGALTPKFEYLEDYLHGEVYE